MGFFINLTRDKKKKSAMETDSRSTNFLCCSGHEDVHQGVVKSENYQQQLMLFESS